MEEKTKKRKTLSRFFFEINKNIGGSADGKKSVSPHVVVFSRNLALSRIHSLCVCAVRRLGMDEQDADDDAHKRDPLGQSLTWRVHRWSLD